MLIDEYIEFVTHKIETGRRIDFIEFYESHIKVKNNAGTRRVYNTSLKDLKKYTNGVLFTDEIDFDWLTPYQVNINSHSQGRAAIIFGKF